MQAFLNCLAFHSLCRLHFFTVYIEATYTHGWCSVKWVTFNAAGVIHFVTGVMVRFEVKFIKVVMNIYSHECHHL